MPEAAAVDPAANGDGEHAAYFDAWRGGVLDTMIGMPASAEERTTKHYAQINAGILDKEAREQFAFPAQYMFKDVPDYENIDDPVALLLAEMDRFNIRRGMINVGTNPVEIGRAHV